MKSLLIAAVFASIASSSVAAQVAQAAKSDAPQATIAMPDNI
jgi:hypothetical protein